MKYLKIFVIIATIFCMIDSLSAQSDCEQTKPSIILDCAKLSTSVNSCCYIKNGTQASCGWWGTKYVGTTNKNNITYHCDNSKGTTCGPANPISVNDCKIYGASTNSCCYYKDKNSIPACMWFAQYYAGSTSYNGYDVTCHSRYAYISIASLIISLVLILL